MTGRWAGAALNIPSNSFQGVGLCDLPFRFAFNRVKSIRHSLVYDYFPSASSSSGVVYQMLRE